MSTDTYPKATQEILNPLEIDELHSLEPITEESRDIAHRPNWSIEANFMLLPIFSFDRNHTGSSSQSSVITSLPSVKDGKVIKRQLLISTGSREVDGKSVPDHRPGAFDMGVLFCLMDLWDEEGRPEDGKIRFSLSTICNRLRLTDAGKNYQAIKTSILRLSRTQIESKNAFYSAEAAGYVTASMDIISDSIIGASSEGRSGCMVKLGSQIISNLQNNFTARLNRQVYQQLENGFAQRILCLVLFRQQLQNESGVIDFELTELAELLPMSGRLFPSTIINRLKNALSELQDKKVFKSEFLKHQKKHVLRLIPFERQIQALTDMAALPRFEALIQAVYGKSVFELTGLATEALKRLVERDYKVIEFDSRQYLWTYHVIDVFCHMLKHGYKAQDKERVIRFLLSKTMDTLDRRMDYVPLDIVNEKKLQEESLVKTAMERDRIQEEAENLSVKNAWSYLARLGENDYKQYLSKVKANSPLFEGLSESSKTLQSAVVELIKQDILSGKEFKLEQTPIRLSVGTTAPMITGPEGNA